MRLAGFGHDPNFFIPDSTPGIYRTNPRFTETFFSASFGLKPVNFRLPREKPTGAIRVFVLGESAAMGVPEPGFALAPQLRAQLRAAYPDRTVEVYNLGITAINSHVIRVIAAQAAGFEPDVFVLYLGNNEVVGPYGPSSIFTDRTLPLGWIRASIWARMTRTGQLLQWIGGRFGHNGFRDWRGMEMFAGRTVAGNDPRLADVYANFAANLAAILQTARGAGAKVVLSTVAVNLADCAPFVSLHRRSLSGRELAAWQQAYNRAVTATDLGEFANARGNFERALRIDPEFAAAHFRLARLLPTSAARREYLAALQWDALRFRADARINAIIRSEAQTAPAGSVQLVDAAEALGAAATSTAAPADHRLFFEHVHLTWEGNYALARLVAPAVATAVSGRAPRESTWLSADACAERVGFTAIGRLDMLMRMNELTAQPPFTGQLTFAEDRAWYQAAINAATGALHSTDELDEAVRGVENASAADPGNAFLVFHAAAANLQARNYPRALELTDRLAALEPVSAEATAQKAVILEGLGRSREAEATLLDSAGREPYYFQTYALLAQLWIGTNRLGEARVYFADLVSRMPDSIAVRLAYAQVLATSGEWNAAEQQWREILQRSPDNEAALDPLIHRLMELRMADAALGLMLKAYAENPRSYPNNARLLQFFGDREDRANVAKFMGALENSGPVNPALHSDRGELLLDLGRRDEALVELVKAQQAAAATNDAEVSEKVADLMRTHNLVPPRIGRLGLISPR